MGHLHARTPIMSRHRDCTKGPRHIHLHARDGADYDGSLRVRLPWASYLVVRLMLAECFGFAAAPQRAGANELSLKRPEGLPNRVTARLSRLAALSAV